MSTITIIEAHPDKHGLVRIFVDGQLWRTVRAATVVACGLRKGDAATPEVLRAIEQADEGHRAYDSALRLLSYRPRSEGELRGRLLQKGIGEAAIDDVLARLRRAGLVDDAAFAEVWVQDRGRGAAARGTAGLRAELRAKGVDQAVIAEAIAPLHDERERALEVARPRAARLEGLPYADFSRRLGGFLQRRGFTYDAVSHTVRTLWREHLERHEPEAPD